MYVPSTEPVPAELKGYQFDVTLRNGKTIKAMHSPVSEITRYTDKNLGLLVMIDFRIGVVLYNMRNRPVAVPFTSMDKADVDYLRSAFMPKVG